MTAYSHDRGADASPDKARLHGLLGGLRPSSNSSAHPGRCPPRSRVHGWPASSRARARIALRQRSRDGRLVVAPDKPSSLENCIASGPLQGRDLQGGTLVVSRYAGIAVFHGLIMALTFDPCKPLKTRRDGRGSKLIPCGPEFALVNETEVYSRNCQTSTIKTARAWGSPNSNSKSSSANEFCAGPGLVQGDPNKAERLLVLRFWGVRVWWKMNLSGLAQLAEPRQERILRIVVISLVQDQPHRLLLGCRKD